MKSLIPSLTHLVRATTDTIRRFPVSTSAALLATGCLIVLIAQEAQGQHPLVRVAVAALIGIPVGLAFQLRAEYQGMGGWKRVAMAVAPVALVAAYAFTLPSSLETMSDDSHHGYRFAQLFIVSHLLAAFLPVGGAAFWRMNKTFFLRILLAALYSFVLQIGLSLSLLSLRMLFGLDVEPKMYAYLFVTVSTTFNTLFGGYAFMAHASINPGTGSGVLRVIGADTLRYDAPSSSFSFGGYTADLYGIDWKATDRPSVKVGPVMVLFISAWIVDGRLESADVAVMHD
jgi:hypothetical protein